MDSIPRPAPGTWSVDTTGTLRPETLAEVNRLGTDLEASGKGQLAVVMVDSTEGVQPRAFATNLFNRWGIGHADRDDGVLLFVAMSDRKVEIVLGDGVDSATDTRHSDALMGRIIPLFKAGNTDEAVLEGTRGLQTLLAQSPLNGGSRNTFGGLFAVLVGLLPVLLIVGLIGLLLYLVLDKSSGPHSGGGHYFGGGYSGGGSSGGGGGGFGGGGSSGGGSSGGF